MMPVMPVLANGGTYIKPFLETSTLYLFGDQPCTPLASKRGLAPSLDDIEEEFAKHRQLIRQTGNVVDDKTTE